jgi:hypothetical protein
VPKTLGNALDVGIAGMYLIAMLDVRAVAGIITSLPARVAKKALHTLNGMPIGVILKMKSALN